METVFVAPAMNDCRTRLNFGGLVVVGRNLETRGPPLCVNEVKDDPGTWIPVSPGIIGLNVAKIRQSQPDKMGRYPVE